MAKKGRYSKHPCIYIDDYGAPHLIIFRNFFVELDLPKYQKKVDPASKKDYDSIVNATNITIDNSIDSKDSDGSNIYSSLIPSWRQRGYSNPRDYEYSMENSHHENANKKRSFLSKLLEACKITKNTDIAFNEVKESMKIPNTPDMKKSLETVENLHKMLKQSGQYVQAEKVENYARILTFELNLMSNGYVKYLTEKDIIDFMLKYQRGISITFLRYFSDILPLDVTKKKIEADKLKVFDNYVILYYDPKQEVFTWHSEDEQKRLARDPILFGMIDGSDKLYYICDWIYKDDDITMEKVEEITGRSAKFLKDAEIADTQLNIDNTIHKLSEYLDSIQPIHE